MLVTKFGISWSSMPFDLIKVTLIILVACKAHKLLSAILKMVNIVFPESLKKKTSMEGLLFIYKMFCVQARSTTGIENAA